MVSPIVSDAFPSGLSDFSRTDYAGYLRVNRTFAMALAKLVCPSDLVWVHDYHLIPLAAELRPLGLTRALGSGWTRGPGSGWQLHGGARNTKPDLADLVS